MTLRPVQTSFVDGTERPVGPIPESIVVGDNAALIAAVGPLYLTGSVLDVTYGRGAWWKRYTPDPFVHHDLAQDGIDFRDLPYEDGSWDAVCFDPPYLPSRSMETSTGRAVDHREAFGLDVQRTHSVARQNRLGSQLHKEGSNEASHLSAGRARRGRGCWRCGTVSFRVVRLHDPSVHRQRDGQPVQRAVLSLAGHEPQ
jgi:hypothetical protein